MDHSLSDDELERTAEIDFAAADRNFNAITARAPWLLDLPREVKKILNLNASRQSKLNKLFELADRIIEAVGSSSACRGAGCSFCCYQSVSISAIEAERIQNLTGIRAKLDQSQLYEELGTDTDLFRARNFRKPCTFLSNGRCDIFAARPLACRLLFNVGASPAACHPGIPIEKSRVASLDFSAIWMAYVAIAEPNQADVRDFFPSGARARAPEGPLPLEHT